ncbi:GNAT family N-acetyltransferase [Streptomyces sp. DSM 44915]|uniref:Lysine N-acyltransferase MbtK n=1 Tax=Streptomyces chisholmiae TaxID=3075540 RepID=A0ABU2JNU8_9ACTN|nr:GNAT family N-acetyltransferase [Streptomyces sp. DSM 44915]MDT0266179.1 GNAT family N-acetyltransferase [Streptomyces sp. DSM 44915]
MSPPDQRPARPVEPLDELAGWGPVATPAGSFRLEPVRPKRDLALLGEWMNDPAVDAFWGLAGPLERTAGQLRRQLSGDGHSLPCLGLLDDRPMSYWEIYRADLDPLARYYPALDHDLGVHLLIGRPRDRGRGLGSVLLRGVAELALRRVPGCQRVVAEPDIRNHASVAAFRAAGFRQTAELELPDKRAALLVRGRGPASP